MIAALKPYPEQRAIFGDLPETELRALAESMRRHGLRHPVEILPDGTIIAGHQRVRAASEHLGWTQIEVIVRHDLAAQGDAAVRLLVLADNLDRRQLDPIARARALKAQADLLRVKFRSAGTGCQEFRAWLAERLGGRLSGRQLDRYLRLLETTIEVQQAVSSRQLTMDAALRIAGLAGSVQQEVVRRIQHRH